MKFDAKNAKLGTMLNMDICQGGWVYFFGHSSAIDQIFFQMSEKN